MMMKTPEPEGGDVRRIHHELSGQHVQTQSCLQLSFIRLDIGCFGRLGALATSKGAFQAGVFIYGYNSVM